MPTPSNGSPSRREVTNPYEDYADEYHANESPQKAGAPPPDDYSDTAMLDSVILPAIASVRSKQLRIMCLQC